MITRKTIEKWNNSHLIKQELRLNDRPKQKYKTRELSQYFLMANLHIHKIYKKE